MSRITGKPEATLKLRLMGITPVSGDAQQAASLREIRRPFRGWASRITFFCSLQKYR